MKKYKITLNWVTYVGSDNPDEVFLKEMAKNEFNNLISNVYLNHMQLQEVDPDSEEYKKDSIRHDVEGLVNFLEKSENVDAK